MKREQELLRDYDLELTNARRKIRELEAFVSEVKAMRVLQKRYFVGRSRTVLQESKNQERCVDRLVDSLLEDSTVAQGDLFGGSNG
ncbi:hypothetical protein [Synechococcus sp. PCC 6312]|uniref:hypothetical protein n=1 Tax=Synechococcus sp. (strain ATCC 27167 / PCC 6312) TaxID=195253 RepID=UPI00029EF462|nr:hypothetical protein [Synechococcus sp. PCC 6312]AFY60336.1 hypothetical protein Syn6312_1147 [Synechococcus sp. PCC 6312]